MIDRAVPYETQAMDPVYEPPAVVEVGRFAELTRSSGGGSHTDAADYYTYEEETNEDW